MLHPLRSAGVIAPPHLLVGLDESVALLDLGIRISQLPPQLLDLLLKREDLVPRCLQSRGHKHGSQPIIARGCKRCQMSRGREAGKLGDGSLCRCTSLASPWPYEGIKGTGVTTKTSGEGAMSRSGMRLCFQC
jgi:hypothetical protein